MPIQLAEAIWISYISTKEHLFVRPRLSLFPVIVF
jgi:hypothetical protein